MSKLAKSMRHAAAIVTAAGTLAAPDARALDRDVMTNILSPVYLAKNFTSVCVKLDQSFLEETRGQSGTALEVTKHIEDEILATMSREEAAPIVIAAAGHARAVGLGLIRALAGGSVEEQAERLRRLCGRTAKPFVKGVVEDHETRHEFFERMLRDARQG